MPLSPPPTRRLLLAGAGSAAALGLAACGEREASRPADGRTHLRFATDWKAQAELGGFYQAQATGLYAARGLDVQLIQGGPAVNVPQLLASGAVDLGIASTSFIAMNMAAEGAPAKAVAAVFQKDPWCLIAHDDPAIRTPADLRGHPILLSDASVSSIWLWLKARFGFTDDQVRKYTFSPAPFLADRRAAQQGYISSEPYTLRRAGAAPNVFLMADHGYPGYANIVMATDRLLAERPAAVRAFVEASAEGWRDYLHGDPAAGDAAIRRDNPEMPADVLAQARDVLRRNAIVEAPGAAIGSMRPERWAAFKAAAGNLYPADLDPARAYAVLPPAAAGAAAG